MSLKQSSHRMFPQRRVFQRRSCQRELRGVFRGGYPRGGYTYPDSCAVLVFQMGKRPDLMAPEWPEEVARVHISHVETTCLACRSMSLRSKSGLKRQTGWTPIWKTVAMGMGSGEFQASWRRQRRRQTSFQPLTAETRSVRKALKALTYSCGVVAGETCGRWAA